MELRTSVHEHEEQPTTVVDADVSRTLIIRGTGNPEATTPPLTTTATADNVDNTPSTSRGPAIRWVDGTIDNEFMGRKKSNCCCIYEKPRRWDESSSSCSSSSSDSEDKQKRKPVHCTDNCRGHTRRCYRKRKKPPVTDNMSPENTTTTATATTTTSTTNEQLNIIPDSNTNSITS
ncbi:unnamed protein product [Trichobilharzia szidati]|nr:unnamed protein product [Trichobilharzia szidati]